MIPALRRLLICGGSSLPSGKPTVLRPFVGGRGGLSEDGPLDVHIWFVAGGLLRKDEEL